jgi:hypothetical protein
MGVGTLNFKTDRSIPNTSSIYYIIRIFNSKIVIGIMKTHFFPRCFSHYAVVNIQELTAVKKNHAAMYHKHGEVISIKMGSEMQVALSQPLQEKVGLNLMLLMLVMKLYFDWCKHAGVNACSYFLKT